MLACPNLSDPVVKSQWDALENDPELGFNEAVREYLHSLKTETDMRSPKEVKLHLAKQWTPPANDREANRRKKEQDIIFEKTGDPNMDPDTLSGLEALNSPLSENGNLTEELDRSRALEILHKLSEGLNIKYAIVSPEEAATITQNAINPFKEGKSAFYYGDTVYFIGDKLSTKIVLHEFSHPIIRSIKQENPVLFNKLYEAAIANNPELVAEAINEYQDLQKTIDNESNPEIKARLEAEYSDLVQEEVLVKALTKASLVKDLKNTKTGFGKVIADIFYAIKKMLRKIFGQKINISKLDSNTTLSDLADMLVAGGNIQINTPNLSSKEMVAYFDSNSESEYIEDLTEIIKKTGNNVLLQNIRRIYEGSVQNLQTLRRNKNLKELLELLTDEYNRGDLQEMRSNLSKYADDILHKAEILQNTMTANSNEVQALVSSMVRLEKVVIKMEKHLTEMLPSLDPQESMRKSFYYAPIIKYWEDYVKEALNTMTKENVSSRSPINQLLQSIQRSLEKSSSKLVTMSSLGAGEVLWEQWQDAAQQQDELFGEMIEKLKKNNASKNAIDRHYIEYYGMPKDAFETLQKLQKAKLNNATLSYEDIEKLESLEKKQFDGLRMTKTKLLNALKGEGKDANWHNSYLEGYMYNTDPVIGGFAMYYKNNMTEMENRAQSRLNEMVSGLEDLVDKAGVKFMKIGELGQKIGFVDTIGSYDSTTGSFVSKKVWTLLNMYKDYRFVKDQYAHNIRELQKRYNKTGNEADKILLIVEQGKLADEERKHFYQKYVDDFYKKDDYFERDLIGVAAANAREELFKEINLLQDREVQDEQTLKELANAWRKYRLLYSLHTEGGPKKTGTDLNNPANNIEIAQRLIDHREYTRQFYEFKERPGVFQNSFKTFKEQTYQKLKAENLLELDSVDFNLALEDEVNKWLARNTRISIKPSFYAERAKILERIKSIMSKLESAKAASDLDFTKHWEIILDTTAAYRDDDRQPIGNEIPDGRRQNVKDAQKAILQAKKAWAGFSGLRVEEMDELKRIIKKRKSARLTSDEKDTYDRLINTQNTLGLSKFERAELTTAFEELDMLQSKVPTEYYLDTLNHFIEGIATPSLLKIIGLTTFDEGNIELLYDPEIVKILSDESPEFKTWFDKNHIKKEAFDIETKLKYDTYERLYIWNVTKPNDPDYYESTIIDQDDVVTFDKLQSGVEILLSDGSTAIIESNENDIITLKNGDTISKKDIDSEIQAIVKTIPGLPKQNFYARVVKKEFYTGYDKNILNADGTKGAIKLIVGKHVDNDYKFLPKDVPNSPYINKEYLDLKNAPKGSEKANLFNLLEKIKEQHLQNQEGVGSNAKLYLDFPRYEKSNLEVLQSGGVSKKAKETGTVFSNLFKRFKDFFRNSATDVGADFNWKQENQLVRASSFDDQIEGIPIEGLAKLTEEETSTDIITSVLTYMYNIEHYKQLVKMNPIALGIKTVLDTHNLKEPNKINRFKALFNGEISYVNKEGEYVRREAFNNLYEREFKGKTTKGPFQNNKVFQNIQRFLMKKSSFAFFALNITSALKNTMSAKFQSMIETAAGNNITVKSLVKGEVWSLKYMMKLSGSDIYKKGPKSLEHQIGEIFDPSQGRFKDKMAKSFTRSLLKDVTESGVLYNFRKWTELEATMQTFGGMMFKQKVKMNGTDIDYMDAWELDSTEQIVLKKGIDKRWDNKPTVYTVQKGDTAKSIADSMNMSLEDFTIASRSAILEEGVDIKIDNTKFKAFRSRIHSVMTKLNGAYAKWDQPEAQRYLAFRFISFLRRYFTTMAVNRVGIKRWDPGYGAINEGYYLGTLKALRNIGLDKNFKSLTSEDKIAIMKTFTEMVSLYLLLFLASAIFGWDPEDKDRYEKLREKSGHIPLLGTSDNKGTPFDLGGFISLHTLNLLLQVESENDQFINPKALLDVIDLKSLVMGPTVDTYSKIADDIIMTLSGDSHAYYARRVGPYVWQDEEGWKLTAHFAKMYGLTGSSIDPAQGLTNFDKAQAMNR